jgi:hypothetical protein
MRNIKRLLVGFGYTNRTERRGWRSGTHIRLKLARGSEKTLPPNLANYLRVRDWRRLKQLIAHIRTVTPLVVEPLNDPGSQIEGWTEEQDAEGHGQEKGA